MARRLAATLVAVMVALAISNPAPVAAEVDPTFGWDHRPLAIGGTYQAVAGQFGGDLATDILFYAPGAGPDSLWLGSEGERGQPSFTKVALTINGDYRLIVGDFAGDDYDDIVFYGPGAAADSVWVSVEGPGYFDSSGRVAINGDYQPDVLRDYRALGAKDDIVFLAPGSAPDYVWHLADSPGTTGYVGSGSYTSRPVTVNGTYRTVVGDFSGDGLEDLVLHAPGTSPDYKWIFDANANFAQTSLAVNGHYQPVPVYAPRFDGILWWGNGAPSHHWSGDGRSFTTREVANPSAQTGTATPFGMGAALVTMPTARDRQFYGDSGSSAFHDVAAASHDQTTAQPIVGNFDADADDYLDVVWYGPGAQPDELWYGITASVTGSRAAPSGNQNRTTPVTPRGT